MKKLLLVTGLVSTMSVSALAGALECSQSGGEKERTLGVYRSGQYSCHMPYEDATITNFETESEIMSYSDDQLMMYVPHHKVSFTGYGLGLQWLSSSKLKVHCTAKEEQLAGTLYGVRAGVGLFVGGSLATFAGQSGLCAAYGYSFTDFGASLSAVKMEISKPTMQWVDFAETE